jgi:hypothetical protein
VVELVEYNTLHLDVGDLVLLGDELLVHDLKRVDATSVLLLGPHHLSFFFHRPASVNKSSHDPRGRAGHGTPMQ